jgi:O-acetyl-ADP-ribose deacetylase (regulator of RNase III)
MYGTKNVALDSMINYKQGNLLHASTDALVNAVNTVGVMGKGIALQFKNAYPENYYAYLEAVKRKELHVGKVQIVPLHGIYGVKYIINFPTKIHWRNPSELQWIESGLLDLRDKVVQHGTKSVALPALGCGNGGLNWVDVKSLIEKYLGDVDKAIIVYHPRIVQ